MANGDQGAAAFARIARSATSYARAHGLERHFRGVLVAPMLPPPIAELIVGAKQDPQFGPILTVGPELSVIEVNPLFSYEDRAVSVDVAGYLRDIV